MCPLHPETLHSMPAYLQLAEELTAERVRAAAEVAQSVARMERDAALAAVARERRVRHAAEDASAASRSLAAAALRADADVVRPALAQVMPFFLSPLLSSLLRLLLLFLPPLPQFLLYSTHPPSCMRAGWSATGRPGHARPG